MDPDAVGEADVQAIEPKRFRIEKLLRRLSGISLEATQPVLTFLFILAIWEAIVILFDVPRYLFPAPSDVVSKGIEYFPKIINNYWPTLRSALLGYLLAVIVSVPGSLVIAHSDFAHKSVYPGLVVLHMTPKVTLAPLVIAWLGLGLAPKVVVTSLICFMPIVLNGILGFRSLDPEIIYLARSTGAKPWQMFWKIRLPNALPTLFTGLKHGASVAIIGAVVAEYIGGNEGLAYYLVLTMNNLQTDLGMAIMVAMTTIGLVFFFGMHAVERLAIPWYIYKRRTASK